MTLFQSKGVIIYHSKWVIMECPKDILDYYWHWIYKEKQIKLHKPRFGSHISIIRGNELIMNKTQFPWRKYHEKEITFSYSPFLQTNGDYWWLPVTCSFLEELRNELGLSDQVPFGFHLTIGKEN
mgnify:CR=1 FL=1